MIESITTLKTKLAKAKANIAVADEQMEGILQEAGSLGIKGVTKSTVLPALDAETERIDAQIREEQQRMEKAIEEAQALLAGSR